MTKGFSLSYFRCLLAVMALIIVPGFAGVAAAATEPTLMHFDIPAQPLHLALDEFARQSGMQVSAETAVIANQFSGQVAGQFTIDQALTKLLAGTGLQWYRADGGTVVLQSLVMDGTAVLPKVMVKGAVDVVEEDAPYTRAGSSSYISDRDIQRRRGMSVGDMFKGTTGVLVAENRNSGGLNVNIRGMQGQGRVPVLVDGARQETTVYRGYAGATSRSYVDPDLIGGVEIDKGPTMNPQGTGATGGLVSMRTLGADDIVQPGNTWGLRLRGALIGNNSGSPAAPGTPAGYAVARAGSGLGFATQTGYRVDCAEGSALCSGDHDIANVYGPDETLDRPGDLDLKGHSASLAGAWRLSWGDLVVAYATRQQGNYYAGKSGPTPSLDLSERYDRGFYTEVRPRVDGASRFRAEERIVNSNYDSNSLLLKSSIYLDEEQTLEFSYLRYHSDYGELMPSQLIWLGRVRQTEDSTVTANTYTGRYQWESADNDWLDLEARLWHTDTDSLNRGFSDNLLALFGDTPTTENYRRWGGDVSNTSLFPGLGDFQWKYGLAWQLEEVQPKRGEVTPSSPMRDGQRKEFSVFSAVKWTFLPTLTLDAGLRHTRYKSEDNKALLIYQDSIYCTGEPNAEGLCNTVYLDSKDAGLAPMVSLLWEPWEGIQFYAQYAEALRMPSLFETTAGFSVATTPDSNLKPEHTKNRELGFNVLRNGVLQKSDALRVKAAYFQNRTEDYLTRTIPNAWENTSAGINAGFFRMRNIESVEFQGAEMSLEYDNGQWFGDVSGTRYFDIELCHSGSYRRQRCTDYGIASSYVNNMIPPNWEANATLGVRLFSAAVETGVTVTWMGQRNQVPEYNNQTETGLGFAEPIPWHTYTLVDLFATWQVNDALSVDLNIDNLTDEYYLDALSLGMVPAPGRTVRLSAEWRF